MQAFIVNGRSYSSIEEMPPDVRQVYERAVDILADKDQNGMPDILEESRVAGDDGVQGKPLFFSSTQIVVDGRVYARVEDLPPEARRKYDTGMEKMKGIMGDANRNGIPDILEGGI